MARLALTTLTLVSSGTDLEAEFEAFGVDGVAIDNENGDVACIIKNGDASQATITIDVPITVDGLTVPDRTYAIPAGEYWIIRPFSKGVYNQDDSGDSGVDNAVLLDSSITGGTVEILAFKAPKA